MTIKLNWETAHLHVVIKGPDDRMTYAPHPESGMSKLPMVLFQSYFGELFLKLISFFKSEDFLTEL